MDEGSVERLAAKGLADDEFRARLITPRLVQDQAVVLLMATEHRKFVLDEDPAVHRRTFTIRELAQPLDAIAERHSWLTLMAAAGGDRRAVPVAGAAGPGLRPQQAWSWRPPRVRSIVVWERQFAR